MKVRKAGKTDKDEIQALTDELNVYRKKMFRSENKEFHERTGPQPHGKDKIFNEGLFFVAINGDKNVIGFIHGTIDERKNHVFHVLGYIDELFVKEEYRGEGVAKNLFLALEKELKKQGCDHLVTHTDVENDVSQQFYSRVGMTKTTIELWKKLRKSSGRT